MGFIKKWLGLEKKEQEEIIPIPVPDGYCNEVCEICGKVIAMERYKKVAGRYTHKSCYKKQARLILNGEVQNNG